MLADLRADWTSLSLDARVGIIVAIAIAAIPVFAVLFWRCIRYRRTGKEGRRELRRIYRRAASTIVENKSVGDAVLSVIDSPEFFERFVLTESVSRRKEISALEHQLGVARPNISSDEITRISNNVYDRILDGLNHAEYETWRRRAEHWNDEIRGERELFREEPGQSEGMRFAAGYMRIVLTDSERMEKDSKSDAEVFFSQSRNPMLEIPRSSVVQIGEESPESWDKALVAVAKSLSRSKGKHEIHLTCVARWLWCYALGVEIQVHHPLVLYHYQDGTYHRIWKINRQIKELKSPLDDRVYEYDVCGEPKLIREGDDTHRVILALAIGSHRDIDAAFDSYRNSNLPSVPMWEIKRRDVLLPNKPEDWIGAATDLAYAIDHLSAGGSKEIYLFGIMPAILGLMLGSAVGPYRRVHLLQFDGKNTYTEMKELLPRTISNVVGK